MLVIPWHAQGSESGFMTAVNHRVEVCHANEPHLFQVYAYARRASSCGFHLIPVPCDPFALPYTDNSDPLRDPIFVSLNMEALGSDLFRGEMFDS